MEIISQLYWVETGDYLQLAQATSPTEAVKVAFRKKEPQLAGIITEVRPLQIEETDNFDTFYIDTIQAMKSIGFDVK